MTGTRTVLYVAAVAPDAATGAAALERVAPEFAVDAAADLAAIRARAPAVDCVVFAETPTSTAGVGLLEVVDACEGTPLVLYADSSYGPGAARATDGVDGYVRRDAAGAVEHLADEVEWVCRDAAASAPAAGRDSPSKVTRLHEMATRIVACRDEDHLFDLAIEAADAVLAFDSSSIATVEERGDGEWLVPRAVSASGAIDETARELPTDEGIAGETFRTGESLLVDDVRADERATPVDERLRSCLSVPIGEYGVFQAISAAPAAYDVRDLELAEILAAHVEETLGRIRLEERLRERRRTVATLHKGAVALAGADSESEVFDLTVDVAEEILELDVCYLGLVEDGRFVPRGRSTWPVRETEEPLSLDYGLMGESYRTGDSFLVGDAETDPWTHDRRAGYRSCLTVPIGEYGVFQAISTEVDAFDESDLELAELLCSHVTEALARSRAEAELVSERDRLSALFENVPEPTVRYEFVDGEPIVRDVNDTFEAVFGYDRETVVGENIDEYVVPAGADEEAKRLNETLQAGEPLQTVGRRMTADGDRDFLINVVPVAVGERSVEGFSIYADITDQKRRERELAAQNERLDEFASIVSHDLRNPLNVARGYLELARETGDDDHLDEVDRAHERMGELIDALLSLARRGDATAAAEPVSLRDAAERAWCTVEADGADLRLAPDADVVFETDETRLVDVLETLLGNAVEHGGEGVTVTVGATGDGFYVADDGPGVPAGERESIFEFGYTTASDGTGYGLTVVSRIADAHGWEVRVAESEGGGARFEVSGVTVADEADAGENGDREGDRESRTDR
ncbi:GAF domain-containing protein [Salinilacihabitans rarus]|uniref:GAF domain-containing protein n=1 Tax=Salinilacihabitans rarus TaxID=2961596 RepID=UPI0020C875A9|nr:GAF domain-containing protein [Salinilacihabitans rarus]